MKLCVFAASLLASATILTSQSQAQQGGAQMTPSQQTASQYPGGEKVWTTVPIHTILLPKNATVQQLADTMDEWRAAIKGHCITCHTVTTDPTYKNLQGNPEIMPYDDALPAYKASEKMYLLTQEINKRLVNSAMAPVTCGTCHRGKLKPEAYSVPQGHFQSELPTVQVPSKQLTPAQLASHTKTQDK